VQHACEEEASGIVSIIIVIDIDIVIESMGK
jgi:hypothetical protein